MIHTNKGLDIVNKLKIKLEDVDKKAIDNNPSYFYSSLEYKKRKKYLNKVNEVNYDELTSKMINKTYLDRFVNKVKRKIGNLRK